MTDDPATVVISPHLDDAVLSCGQLIAVRPGATVVTVFAGRPGTDGVTPYDAGCGFRSSAAAVDARRVEDARACGALGAHATHLDFLDGQYRDGHVDAAYLAAVLADLVDGAYTFAPLGLRHPDHVAVSNVALGLADRTSGLWLYEELPGRVLEPDWVQFRRASVDALGYTLELGAPDCDGPLAAKAAAARCYRSQVHDRGDLGSEHAWLVPERYWRVVR